MAHQGGALAQAPGGATLEYQVKAAYLYNFVSFTEWPPAALGAPSSPLRICVAGENPFGETLENTVKGESVQGHPLTVERLVRIDAAPQCHVVFVSRTGSARGAELLRTVDGAVLTIGESDDFLKSGGMVKFVVDQGHVRFDVNRSLAEQRGLKFSSRLLRIARSVN